MSSSTNIKALEKLSLDLLAATLKEIQSAHKETSLANEKEKYFATAEYLLQEALEYVTGAWEMISSGKPNASIALSRWVLEASLNLMWTVSDKQKIDDRQRDLIGEALRQDACLFEGYAELWPETREYCLNTAEAARTMRTNIGAQDPGPLEKRVGEIRKAINPKGPNWYPLYRICCAAAHPNLKVWVRFGIRDDDSTFPKDPVDSPSRVSWTASNMAAASTYYLVLSAYILVDLGDEDVLKQWWADQVHPLL